MQCLHSNVVKVKKNRMQMKNMHPALTLSKYTELMRIYPTVRITVGILYEMFTSIWLVYDEVSIATLSAAI